MNDNINILLVDDEVDFLDITRKRLARRGYSVVTAETCAGGVEALKMSAVDVIILDVMLPDLDGIQCLKLIREQFPGTAVILLTGHASMETGLESMECGASDYCLKPVDFDELVDRIEIVYRDRGGTC